MKFGKTNQQEATDCGVSKDPIAPNFRKKSILSKIFILTVFTILGYCLGFQQGKKISLNTENIQSNLATKLFLSPSATNTRCNQSKDGLLIQSSKQVGLCLLSLPLSGYSVAGYSITYPENWKVEFTDVENMNLMFNRGVKSGKDGELFVQITTTELPLNQSDKATYGYELSEPNPLIDPKEIYISKSIENIGNKQVLSLVTENNGENTQRYFLQHKESDYFSLYMFRFSGENKELLESIKQVITSLTFID